MFTDKLVSMGARIILCDPHRAVVTGPALLVGTIEVEDRLELGGGAAGWFYLSLRGKLRLVVDLERSRERRRR